MSFDRDMFDLLGALAGFLGLIVSVGSVLYARRQAIAAEGPRSPHVEIGQAAWMDGQEAWARVTILTRNYTSESWDMTSARLTSPRNCKLIAGHLISDVDAWGNQFPRLPKDATEFSAVTKPSTSVMQQGAGSRLPQGPSADKAREHFYLKIPTTSKSFKLVFTFRRKSGIGKAINLKVIGTLPSK